MITLRANARLGGKFVVGIIGASVSGNLRKLGSNRGELTLICILDAELRRMNFVCQVVVMYSFGGSWLIKFHSLA